MTEYVLFETDLAGNRYLVEASDSFEHICYQSVLAKRIRPTHVYTVANLERADVDCQDGLTDEERELLP